MLKDGMPSRVAGNRLSSLTSYSAVCNYFHIDHAPLQRIIPAAAKEAALRAWVSDAATTYSVSPFH